jgi:dephospho-CoA kinase
VACAQPIQLERLIARSRLSASAALEMINSQMPLTEKISRADHLVWNNGSEHVLAAQARLFAGLLLSN